MRGEETREAWDPCAIFRKLYNDLMEDKCDLCGGKYSI